MKQKCHKNRTKLYAEMDLIKNYVRLFTAFEVVNAVLPTTKTRHEYIIRMQRDICHSADNWLYFFDSSLIHPYKYNTP